MKNIKLNLIGALSFLSFLWITIPGAYALTNIPNGVTVTAPPQADDAMNFQAPAPGGTFEIVTPTTFTGALTNAAADVGTLVLNSNTQLNGAVATGVSPLLQISLHGDATINGAISAQTFNLGQNTLNQIGAINNPTGVVFNTKVISNALFGHISAVGADSVAGPSVTVNVDASGVTALTPGAPLFVVSAQGPTGTLPVNVTSNNVLYSFTGNYQNGNITILPTLNPVIPLPKGVGSVFTELLEVAANNPGSDIATVTAAISALPSESAIESALLQLNPIVDGALPQMSFDAMKQFHNVWTKHMGYGRCIYATDCEEDCSKDTKCSKARHAQCNLENKGNKENKDCCFSEANCKNVKNRYEIWGDGFGYFGHQDTHRGFNGYHSHIFGGMIGFQAPVGSMTSMGLGGGYANSHVHRKQDTGNSTIQTYDATAYISFDPTHWYVDAAASFDFNRYKDSRNIEFPGIDRTARSHYTGQQYSGLIATGYRYYFTSCGILTPLASLQYSYLHVNHYHERGAGDISLHVKEQHFNFLESSLGFKLARPMQFGSGAFVPELHGIWLHDFFGDRMNLRTKFSGVAEEVDTFRTTGPSLDKNRGDVGASLTYISCTRLALQLVYNYEFSKNYHSNEGLLNITYRF